MRELSLFTGCGGGLYASRILGWRTVAMCERDPYCQDVLRARQQDGTFDMCPIFDDVFSLDGTPWRGRVDVLTGGFPCQPFSVAGRRLAGEDPRDGWPHTARLIGEVRPAIAFLENVPGLLTADHGRYFGRILSDLAAIGYDACWTVLGAADVGAPHRRERLWIYAYLPNALRAGLQGLRRAEREQAQNAISSFEGWWADEPDVGRVAHGVARRGDRLRALGNGQCPQSAVAAFLYLHAIATRGV